MKQKTLVELLNEIPDNNIFIDLKDIDRLEIVNHFSVYEGGTDSEGHELKDNYSAHADKLTVEFTDNRIYITEAKADSDFPPVITEYEANAETVNAVKGIISDFVNNGEVINANTYTGDTKETVIVAQSPSFFAERYKDNADIFVLKDKKIPTLLKEFLTLSSLPEANRLLINSKDKTILVLWENNIDYKERKVNVIRMITRDNKTKEDSVWMWMTNREITNKNVLKIIQCAKTGDYIENQGFKEQKITSGIDLEHVYSKNINAIYAIYIIIQLTHMILQIIEHSDICGDFKQKYGSVKVFSRKFFAHLTERYIDLKLIYIKILNN